MLGLKQMNYPPVIPTTQNSTTDVLKSRVATTIHDLQTKYAAAAVTGCTAETVFG